MSDRISFVVKKTVIMIALIFLVGTGLFFIFRLMPGTIGSVLIVEGASPEQVALIEERYGLNEPIYVQYLIYLQNLFTGEMGVSFRYNVDVLQLTLPRLMFSIILAAPAVLVAYILGSLYGAWMGVNKDKAIERYGVIPVTMIGATPEFFTAILLILFFSIWLGLFPTSGAVSVEYLSVAHRPNLELMMLPDFWWHYTLPFLAVVLRLVYLPSLIMRTSVVETRGQEFVRYSRLLGLPSRLRHARVVKHSSLPVITLLPISLSRAIGGLVLVEIVFNWPGMGALLVEAVFARDFPVIQFVFFLIAAWVIVGNYLVDLFYGMIDPRISIEGQG